MKHTIKAITITISLLQCAGAIAQSSTSIVPQFSSYSTTGHGGGTCVAGGGLDPATCGVTAFTTGHFSSLSETQGTTTWTISATYTSTNCPTFVSGTYDLSYGEYSYAWASLSGPSGHAEGIAQLPITSAYDYEPQGDTSWPNPDTFSEGLKGTITNLQWSGGPGAWVGTFQFTTTSSYAYGNITRTYQGSSGDGGEGDTLISVSINSIAINANILGG